MQRRENKVNKGGKIEATSDIVVIMVFRLDPLESLIPMLIIT